MNESMSESSTIDLSLRFPGSVSPDTRPGYSGWIIEKDQLLTVTQSLRDEFEYDYLSSVTGVDYLPEGKIEVVYQVYKITGGSGLLLKVQLPREDPIEIPSLTGIYPGAEFQETDYGHVQIERCGFRQVAYFGLGLPECLKLVHRRVVPGEYVP